MTEFPPLQCSSAFVPWLIQAAAKRDIDINHKLLQISKNHSATTAPHNSAPKKRSAASWLKNKVHSHHSPSTTNGAPPVKSTMDLLQLLAINALEFTAPASAAFFLPPGADVKDVKLKGQLDEVKNIVREQESNRRNFVQLSGHPGCFAPAGPDSLWKKQGEGSREPFVYEHIWHGPTDPLQSIIPKYYSSIEWSSETFLEIQDLLTQFDPDTLAVMDLKLGLRTFLESEVMNNKPRPDLYEKMVKVDPNAPTEEEHASKAVTKLRYMQFREDLSSTSSLGFRIEAIKYRERRKPTSDLQRTKTEDAVTSLMREFLRPMTAAAQSQLLQRLDHVRNTLDDSPFFKQHEVIGSSILLLHDGHGRTGAWLIDFAKTFRAPDSITELSHRTQWKMGNHEDGVLFGMDNLIRIVRNSTSPSPASTNQLVNAFKRQL